MKQKKEILASPFGFVRKEDNEEDSNPLDSLTEEEPQRRQRRERRYSSNFTDFRVEIAKFEGKLDPDEFLEWLCTIKRVSDYEELLK